MSQEPAAEPRKPGMRTESINIARSLVRFGPSPVRWPLALQAGVAMAGPVVLLSLLGREDLGLLAATGAFTLIYGGRLSARERAAFLPFVALVLFAAAAAGAAAASVGPILVMAGLVVFAVGSSLLAFGWQVGAPGPMFPVLVFGLSAHLSHLTDPLLFLGVFAAASVFAYLVSLTPLLRARNRRAAARPLREIFPGPEFGESDRTLVLRAGIIAVVGVAVAAVIDPERAYWIVSAGLGVMGVTASRRIAVSRGVHRAAGSVVGGGLYLLLALFALPGVVLGLVLGALQFLIELVVVRNYALALAFITPLVLLIIGATGHGGMPLAVERVVDTIAGSVIGVLAGLVVLPARRA